MSAGKAIIWGLFCLAMIIAFIKNFSEWETIDLLVVGLFAIGSGIMTYLEANDSR